MTRVKLLYRGTNVPVYANYDEDNKTLLFDNTNVKVPCELSGDGKVNFFRTTNNKVYAIIDVLAPDYLCFTAAADININFTVNGTISPLPVLQYSLDKLNWSSYTFGTNISLSNGKSVYWRGNNSSFSLGDETNNITVASTGNYYASGNIMSLLDKSCNLLTVPNYAFAALFVNDTKLLSAPKLPATTVGQNSYTYLFNGCTGLTSAPALPATTLGNQCYAYMFYGCTGLTSAPALPATTLATGCYDNMFRGCTGLTSIPELPATTLATSCYNSMFKNCTLIKMSATQTGDYTNVFTFGADPTGKATNMFASTGGTFTGDPTTTTYYTSNTIVPAA